MRSKYHLTRNRRGFQVRSGETLLFVSEGQLRLHSGEGYYMIWVYPIVYSIHYAGSDGVCQYGQWVTLNGVNCYVMATCVGPEPSPDELRHRIRIFHRHLHDTSTLTRDRL